MDVAEDGEVWAGSIEWRTDRDDPGQPFTLTVLPLMEPGTTPHQMLDALLAEPWEQESLPFPPQGWVIDAVSYDSAPRRYDRD